MTRPVEDPFTWATDGSAVVDEPIDQRKLVGWVAGFPPPAGQENWINQHIGQWLNYLARTSAIYGSLNELIAGLAVGETGILDESDRASQPGSLNATSAVFATGIPTHLCSDGRRVYIPVAGESLVGAKRDLSDMDEIVFAAGTTTGLLRAVTNGVQVATLCADGTVECFTAATGVKLWTSSFTDEQDIAIDGTQVYVCGAGATGFGRVLAITIATGLDAWSYTHSSSAATLYAIATNGKQVFVAGSASAFASLATLRALNASNGRGATTESGTADTAGLAWDAVQATEQNTGGTLACDASRLFLGYPTGAVYELEKRSTWDGVLVAGRAMAAAVRNIAIDHEWVITNDDGANVHGVAKSDLSIAWRYTTGGTVSGVATDGAAVFVAVSIGVGTSVVLRLNRGNRTQLWQRITGTESGNPYRWQALPSQG